MIHSRLISSRLLPLCVLASVFLCTVASQAQRAGPAVRVVNAIDESQRVTLTHTVSPLANAVNDRGAAPDGMQLDRMQLVLQRSPDQETALRQLIAQVHAPGSPNYHQWLTPDQFGAQFGASDQDIATIESWLGSHGFAVSKVNPGRGSIEFSGSVAQLRDAFHTQIHKYAVNGETHYANANDPQIPAALAPVIGGFASLNNFHPKSYVKKLGKASLNPTTHQVTPSWTWGNSSGENFVLAPGDFAVQYDLQPLYTANVNGAGQTIAIINDSNINIDLVNQFRTLFGLPANPPQVIIDGNDPGVDGINNPDGPNGDSVEAYLDVEWSGAVAPDATIDLVVAGDTSLESGLVLAMEHAVYGNVAPVISLSFGECESALGSTNSFLNGLWEQAAAQGQTVMVSSGDNGSAGCDNDNTQEYAISGQAVSGFASTPYNIAVGGTDFYYSDYATGGASIANYWSTTTTQLPAVSITGYVPEQPWNNGPYGLDIFNQFTSDGSTSIAGGSGGASNCATGTYNTNGQTTACSAGYPKPSWQSGTGVPSDNVRDLPDVSLFAANGDNYSFYPICATDGDCQTAGLAPPPLRPRSPA
jgi:subtilase family serine protease